MNLGTVGIWSGQFRSTSEAETKKHAAILDELGFHTLWIPGGGAESILNAVRSALDATSSLAVASGILSIWLYPPEDVATVYDELVHESHGRCVLGLGVSHAPIVDSVTSYTYSQPLSQMKVFLDGLDLAGLKVDDRILAALGPKMLDLARDRSAGAHPYCTTVEHTKIARERIGENALLAPEVKVLLETDPTKARAISRVALDRYLKLDNYVNNLLRLGWSQEDIGNGGSDALIDALVGWGSEEEVVAHIHAHLVAGADHVALHTLSEEPDQFPVSQWRTLSSLLSDLL